MSRRGRGRVLHGDRGMVTAELAAAIPVLVLLLAFGLAAIDVGRVRIRCVDAAREGALAAARGDDAAGRAAALRLAPGATISITRSEEYVTVEVRAVAALRGIVPDVSVRASSTALVEPTGMSP